MDVKKLREIYDEEWCERAREFVSYEQNSLYSWEWERKCFFLFDIVRPFLFYWGCETWNCFFFSFFAAKQIYAKKKSKFWNWKVFFSFNLDVGKETQEEMTIDEWELFKNLQKKMTNVVTKIYRIILSLWRFMKFIKICSENGNETGWEKKGQCSGWRGARSSKVGR